MSSMAQATLDHLPRTGEGGSFTSTRGPPYALDQEAVLRCAPGYTLPSEFLSKVVFENGRLQWEPSEIHCLPISCGAPPLLPHARPSAQVFTFPHSFRYVCDEGYTFNRYFNHFSCTALGRWTPSIDPNTMRCDPILCPALKAPDNGSVVYGDRAFRAIATFTCDPGFAMIRGHAQRECQQDGTWSGEEVMCGQLPCPPMDPTQVTVLGRFNNFNIVDCGNGETVNVRCLPVGRWALKFPYCDKIPETSGIPPDVLQPIPPVVLQPKEVIPPAPPVVLQPKEVIPHAVLQPKEVIPPVVLQPKEVIPPVVLQPIPPALLQPIPPAVLQPIPPAVLQPIPPAVLQPIPPAVLQPIPPAVLQPKKVIPPAPPAVLQPKKVIPPAPPAVLQPEEVIPSTPPSVLQPKEVIPSAPPVVLQPKASTFPTQPAVMQSKGSIPRTQPTSFLWILCMIGLIFFMFSIFTR